MSVQLQNPPLVEAILEVKWKLNKIGPDSYQDPGYRLAVGRLADRINRRFPFVSELPTVAIPDELTAYVVKYQYRAQPNSWPLVQLGPGVASVNFTSPYSWTAFKDVVKFFIPQVVDSYGRPTPPSKQFTLQTSSVVLRYINAVEMDWSSQDALQYLGTNLHIDLGLPPKIVSDKGIQGPPTNVNVQIGFPLQKPVGGGSIRAYTGRIGQRRGLIWETIIQSADDYAPQMTDIAAFMRWLTDAHSTAEKWFLALVEGDLYEKFKGGD